MVEKRGSRRFDTTRQCPESLGTRAETRFLFSNLFSSYYFSDESGSLYADTAESLEPSTKTTTKTRKYTYSARVPPPPTCGHSDRCVDVNWYLFVFFLFSVRVPSTGFSDPYCMLGIQPGMVSPQAGAGLPPSPANSPSPYQPPLSPRPAHATARTLSDGGIELPDGRHEHHDKLRKHHRYGPSRRGRLLYTLNTLFCFFFLQGLGIGIRFYGLGFGFWVLRTVSGFKMSFRTKILWFRFSKFVVSGTTVQVRL